MNMASCRYVMITILLVDDHELVRTGIEHLLGREKDFRVVGTASSGEEAIELVDHLLPEVILMDINMPGIGGIEACRKISQRHPEIKIIALSVHAEGPFPQQLLSLGAHGYVSKSCPHNELLAAVRSVSAGQRYLSQDIANMLAMESLPGRTTTPFEQLSYRELQVVIMTLQGKALHEVGDMLEISPKTATTYRARAYEKLGVKNEVELTRLAGRFNLSSETPLPCQPTANMGLHPR